MCGKVTAHTGTAARRVRPDSGMMPPETRGECYEINFRPVEPMDEGIRTWFSQISKSRTGTVSMSLDPWDRIPGGPGSHSYHVNSVRVSIHANAR